MSELLDHPGINPMSLQYKVVLLVFGIILTTGIVGGFIALQLQRQSAVSQFSESTMALAATLRDSIERDMLLFDREHIQKSVTLIGSRSWVTEVSIRSPDRRVYASYDTSAIGQTRDEDEVTRALKSGETVTSSTSSYGGGDLFVVFPLLNKPECYVCHGSKPAILGAIKIGWDTKLLDDQIKEQTLVMLLVGGLVLVIMGTSLSFTLRSTVANPLAKLAASARRMADGDFSVRVQFKSKSEVGTVAHAFNDMVEKVQERTEQLQQLVAVRGQLLDRLISAQEEERQHIARELHDGTIQTLVLLCRRIVSIEDNNRNLPVTLVTSLQEVRKAADSALTELREFTKALRPPALDDLGMMTAINRLLMDFTSRTRTQARLKLVGEDRPLPPVTEIALFRITQEAVRNIERHAQATDMAVTITFGADEIRLDVTDNGVGFVIPSNTGDLATGGHLGLISMQERTKLLGGKLEIISNPGYGARLTVIIPVIEGSSTT